MLGLTQRMPIRYRATPHRLTHGSPQRIRSPRRWSMLQGRFGTDRHRFAIDNACRPAATSQLGVGGYRFNRGGTPISRSAPGYSYNIALGGLPSGIPRQGWYDLQLSLTATESFNGLQANYEGTGGTNGSNQNNVNLVQCDTNGPWYGWSDPVCAGWFPQGEMVSFDHLSSPGPLMATAAQINPDATALTRPPSPSPDMAGPTSPQAAKDSG